MNTMQQPDVVIAGAGVIGLSLALELRNRGRSVLIVDRKLPGLASRAAAGMLAAHDPHNPLALQALAEFALQLYPGFLDEVRRRSGHTVPIQTREVLESFSAGETGCALLPSIATDAGRFVRRPEDSLDPRQLHTALLAAVQQTGIAIALQDNHAMGANRDFVDCTGAWSPIHTRPAKGQMLRVQLPPDLLRLPSGGNAVVRTEKVYVVPRLDGSALIGATVEDAGFDLSNRDSDIDALRTEAAAILPALARAPELERWAGLRPRTADDLPIVGKTGTKRYVANGLFRNGILLAPAVARVMAQQLSGEPTSVALEAFSPDRAALCVTR